MSGLPTVFLGPSLPRLDAVERLPADYHAPAAAGDVWRAVEAGARTILLIDGVFETDRAVWHKELLFALSRGVRLLGASSLGALRAAELAPFGMRGIGRIFEAYRNRGIEDDAEVAVTHAPAEFGFRPLSEALVDVRATLEAAVAAGLLETGTALHLVKLAAGLYYKDRSWEAVLGLARSEGMAPAAVRRLAAWLPDGRIEQKRLDALAALAAARSLAAGPPAAAPVFEETVFWRRFVREMGEGGE